MSDLSAAISTDDSKPHAALCKVAVAWLRRPPSKGGPSCSFAVSETAPMGADEIPDAIGWREGKSVLVEVKVSRSDFLADRQKPHRLNPSSGMGVYRYFMAPVGMIRVDELPPKWGLVEVSKTGTPKAVAGHVMDRHLKDKERWTFSPALDRECWFLSRLVAQIGDPEDVLAKIKKASRLAAQFERAWQKERAAMSDLNRRYCELMGEMYALREGRTA